MPSSEIRRFSINQKTHKEASEALSYWEKQGKNISDIICTLVEEKRRAEIKAELYGDGITSNDAFLGALTPEQEQAQHWKQELKEIEESEYERTLHRIEGLTIPVLRQWKEDLRPEKFVVRMSGGMLLRLRDDDPSYINNEDISKQERQRRIKEQEKLKAMRHGMERAVTEAMTTATSSSSTSSS